MPTQFMDSVILALFDLRMDDFAMTEHGSRILNSLVQRCKTLEDGLEIIDSILQQIVDNLLELARDGYGSNVVLTLLTLGRHMDKSKILEVVSNRVVEIASDKDAAWLFEECYNIQGDKLEHDKERLTDSMILEAEKLFIDVEGGQMILEICRDGANGEDKARLTERLEQLEKDAQKLLKEYGTPVEQRPDAEQTLKEEALEILQEELLPEEQEEEGQELLEEEGQALLEGGEGQELPEEQQEGEEMFEPREEVFDQQEEVFDPQEQEEVFDPQEEEPQDDRLQQVLRNCPWRQPATTQALRPVAKSSF